MQSYKNWRSVRKQCSQRKINNDIRNFTANPNLQSQKLMVKRNETLLKREKKKLNSRIQESRSV